MPKKNDLLSLLAIRARWETLKEAGYALEGLEIRSAGRKGMGVFALRDFEVGEVIEYCHCIPLSTPSKYMADGGIKQYAYWDRSGLDAERHGGAGLVVMGFGSVYNSADCEAEMNCKNYVSAESRMVAFVASRRIRVGEEIVTWWGQAYYDAWCKNG
jgi:hypothetical protein